MESHIRAICQLTQLRTDLKQKKAYNKRQGEQHLRQMTGLKKQFDHYKRELVIMVQSIFFYFFLYYFHIFSIIYSNFKFYSI